MKSRCSRSSRWLRAFDIPVIIVDAMFFICRFSFARPRRTSCGWQCLKRMTKSITKRRYPESSNIAFLQLLRSIIHRRLEGLLSADSYAFRSPPEMDSSAFRPDEARPRTPGRKRDQKLEACTARTYLFGRAVIKVGAFGRSLAVDFELEGVRTPKYGRPCEVSS